jgi:signal peptidase II
MEMTETQQPAGAESPGVKPATHRYAFWLAAVAVVGLDQMTKAIVRSSLEVGESWPDEDWFIKIHHVTNSGAAFGILRGETPFLIVMALIGVGAIYLYYRYPPFNHWAATLGIGMLLGGASGNLIDRVRMGRVTDFVDVGDFPSFNVADSAINIGVATIIIGYLWFEARRPEVEPEPEPASADEDG